MKGVLNERTLRHIRFKLYDAGRAVERRAVSASSNDRLLFDSNQLIRASTAPSANENPDDLFTRVLPIEVGGRIWEAQFSGRKNAIIDRVDRILPWTILVGGILSSLFLFGMIHFLSSSRSRAVAMANEITKDLRASESSLAEAQQIAHLGNWSLDPQTWSMNWSAETYRILGLAPRVIPMVYSDFLRRVHKDDRDAIDQAIRRAVASGRELEIEHRISLDDGSIRWVHTIVKPILYDREALVPGTITDITERKLAQEKVIESETLLNEAQKLSHLGCWQWNISDGQVVWSEELYRIYGTDTRAFCPSIDNHLAMVHPEDQAIVDQIISTAARTGQGFTIEERIVRPDGEIRHVLGHGDVVKDTAGRPVKVLGACLDVTEQKHAGEALQASAEQLQALSRRLVEIQELERRQFSRELHDRIGQNLTALSINLDILKTELSDSTSAGVSLRLDDSAALLEATSGAIEDVIAELRPPMLDDYGLLPALQWYGNEFARRIGIEVRVYGDEQMKRLTLATEIALFRIAQEALNNIAKHARADTVEIRLEHTSSECVMSVADDGVGFDSATIANSKRRPSLGMVTMRERTQAIGGHFEVKSASGEGTQVLVRIPL